MKRLLSIWLCNWPIQRLQRPEQAKPEQAKPEQAKPEPTHPGAVGQSARPPEADPAGSGAAATDVVSDGVTDAAGQAASRPPQTPLILWRHDPRRGRLVVACCRQARRRGVRPGLAIAQAMELAEGAQDSAAPPRLAEHDPVADTAALQRLAKRLQQCLSPLVAIESTGKRPWAGCALAEPETIFCQIDGLTHLFGSEADLLAETHRVLAAEGWTGRLAIAANPAAAWALAHYSRRPDFISQRLTEDLEPLPVAALRLEAETQTTLRRLGIESIGELWRLPRSGLARRLGPGLPQRIAEALGEVETPLEFHQAPAEHRCSLELEYPTEDLEILRDRVQRLTARLADRLRPQGCGVLRLHCRLDAAEHAPWTTTVGLFAPTLDAAHLSELICSSVESLPIRTGITKVTLSVIQSEPLRSEQPSLLGGADCDVGGDAVAAQSLARLVDSLTMRLGRQAVLGVHLGENPLPEKAYRTYPLTDHRQRRTLGRRSRRSSTSASRPSRRHQLRLPSRHDARRRPLKLLRRPVALTPLPLNDSPRSATSSPRSARSSNPVPGFRYQGRPHHPLHYWGPERIETAWWDGPAVRRDYYRVETDRGALWWVFQDLVSGEWFLHGRFA
jgi:protein ImuB